MTGRARVDSVVVTCEHGGNDVPPEYRGLFRGARAVLATHRGYDIGALLIARAVARSLRSPLHESIITRLLVDLNRSMSHPMCFSEWTSGLLPRAKGAIVRRYYTPYRTDVEKRIRALIGKRRRVLHLSVHSFTPVLGGVVRSADLGLLYDPSRPREKAFCALWRESLIEVAPRFRVRRNYPYQGRSDGLVTTLRRTLGPRRYIGVELEINQALLVSPRDAERTEKVVVESLRQLLKPGVGSR